jgi:hypothetical protein
MMKITTSTSITSTSGVMLMSLMGCGPWVRSSGRKPWPHCAPDGVGQQLAQVAREAFQVGLDAADQAAEHVVAQHGRDGHRQAGGRHDQRFADRPGHLVDGDLARQRDAVSAW